VCYLLEEHLDDAWKYEILPNRQSGDRPQLCAVMWNTKRLTLADVSAFDVDHKAGGLNLWDRKPHVLTFKSSIKAWRRDEDGKWVQLDETRSLSIVPLHMKSNYGGGTTVGVRPTHLEVGGAAAEDGVHLKLSAHNGSSQSGKAPPA
jgi:hypothetical protein